MKTQLILLSFLLFIFDAYTQDTLKVVQYNLLNYGNYTDYCTVSNNDINDKDQYLKTIITYLKPDILAVNEMSNSSAIQQRMLDYNLNINGVTYYRMANFIKVANSYIVNQLYYNSDKLTLFNHEIAQSYIRDIDVYKLYYNSSDLYLGDTTKIECVVAHLKAGNNSGSASARASMVNNTIDYLLSTNTNTNYLFMGDFNTYTSSEEAYRLLTNNLGSPITFFDPIDTPGDWNNNYDFRFVHTQSTHANQNGCASHGGMDDRFDFILISENVKYGIEDVEYVQGSYQTIGQDGKHFNKSVNESPQNLSAPEEVISALYGNSDHLPVMLKLKVNKTLGINNKSEKLNIVINNPVFDEIEISIKCSNVMDISYFLLSLSGNIIATGNERLTAGVNKVDISSINSGMYLLAIIDGNQNKIIRKVVVL